MTNPNDDKKQLLAAVNAAEALIQQYKYNKIQTYFTEGGKNSKDNYPKQLQLMRAGRDHNLRAFIGGNGSGKSVWLSYESYVHLSGKYPKWWDGKKFRKPINAWLCGLDAKALRSGLQQILFGGIGDDDFGTGMIPREDMTDDNGKIQKWNLQGTANAIGQFRVKHFTDGIFDGWSTCEFMTYEQGWQSFQGPTKQWIGFDEEPEDGKIFAECIARLRGRDGDPMGHFLATFTPTAGFRDVYLSFVPNGEYPANGLHPDDPSKFTQRVGWKDSPHLSEEWKAAAIAQWKLTDPNNIMARTEGIAAMGSGRIYPVEEEYVTVETFKIPDHWRRAFGLDFASPNGFTACVWIAEDPNTNIRYVYSEYKRSKAIDEIHIESIKEKGMWIPGACDPSSGIRDNGTMRSDFYRSKGLDLTNGENAIIGGISSLLSQFETGSLKIMSHCTELLKEYRLYRYDTKDINKPAKNQQDHLLDALRYVDSLFEWIAKAHYDERDEMFRNKRTFKRDVDTGY
jgi:phage terminase large subunit-like protein